MYVKDVKDLYEYLKHGDKDHQEWLLEAIEAWSYGWPVPEVRGSGNKEKIIKDLQLEIKSLKEKYGIN